MNRSLPVFAFVGHPNEGKTSVIATLTENDSAKVSPTPGETKINRRYSLCIDDQTFLTFIDTPGFQHPRRLLDWFRRQDPESTELAKRFREVHRNEPALRHDLELLAPLAQGCGAVFVVDGSRPANSVDKMEMEILRLCGNPRMALINPKHANDSFLAQWKHLCSQSFNLVRLFNAHQATYLERLALLESLKAINQDWEPYLVEALQAFRADWDARIRQTAGVVCELLEKALTHVETRRITRPEHEKSARTKLTQDYRAALKKIEKNGHKKIRRLFRHRVFNVELPPQSLLQDQLFTSRTWRVLGLSKNQTIGASALLGATVGAKLDLMTAGLSFGIFTLGGGLATATAAWMKGEALARTRLKRLSLGGVELSIGPHTDVRLPFVLLDRSLLCFRHFSRQAHVCGDPTIPATRSLSPEQLGLTAQWSRQRLKRCTPFLKALRSGTPWDRREPAERQFKELLEQVLNQLAEEKVPDEL